MSPKHHHIPLSGGDRKALKKELSASAGIERMLADQAADARARGEELIRRADDLDCQSWNERMWRAGGPIDPSPTVAGAINGGFSWLEIECSRCHAKRAVDLARLKVASTTFVHDLTGRLRCQRCDTAGKRPAATLLQLAPQARFETPTT
jgi:hypothetical protein